MLQVVVSIYFIMFLLKRILFEKIYSLQLISVTNKTRLAEKRYKNKLQKDKKEIRLKTKKHKKQNKKFRKSKEDYENYSRQLQKTRKSTKLQKKKENELNKKRKLIRRQTESNKEIKRNERHERRQKRENIVDDIDLGRFFELATSNRIYVNNLYLHEIKNEILQGYTGDFELNEKMVFEPVEHRTNIRFINMDDSERCINKIDVEYDSEDVTFTGYVYKLNTPQFKIVERSACGKSTNYMQEIVEYHGQNCYIPTSGMCFIKCINSFTKKDYTEDFLTFI